MAKQRQQQQVHHEDNNATLRLQPYLLPLGSLLLWGLCSSAMIIINKHLLVDVGFTCPLLLTGLNQATSALTGGVHVHASLMHNLSNYPP